MVQQGGLSPTEKRRRRTGLALALLGLAAFLGWRAWSLRWFLEAETRPPSWDQSIHLEIAWDYRQALDAGRPADAWRLPPKPGMPPFPPLYHLALSRLYRGVPDDPARVAAAALWLNWGYLCLLCVCVFGIAWDYRGEMTALAAAVVIGCAPEVLDLSRTQLLDLPLAAMAAAAYWALLRADGFRSWPGSLAFGAAFAAGMMHKWSFFSYMLPAGWALWTALRDPSRRARAMASMLLAAAGFGPWYWTHLPILPARLVQASADNAVPVWKGTVFFGYFLQMPDRIGPLLWLLGVIGLIVPFALRRADHAWLVPAWFLSSYVFWAVVPNRQMRFLLPGITPLAVSATGFFPKPLIWVLAAVQLAAAANYDSGALPPVQVPFVSPITLFVSSPPRKEAWPIQPVLEEAARRHPAGEPFSNLTLVANDIHFNDPTFVWTGKTLGLKPVFLRGVNKRLCEFSRFVVLKEGHLGPPTVIPGLPEAAQVIQDKASWFQRAYEEVARWPLPDGSSAVLFSQRRWSLPPFKERNAGFPKYEAGRVEAVRMKVDLGHWDPARSAYPSARVQAAEVSVQGLKARDVSLVLEDALIIPAGPAPGARPWEDVRFLKLGRLKVVGLRLAAADLQAFLESRVKGLKVSSVELDKTARVKGSWRGVPLTVEAAVSLEERPEPCDPASQGPSRRLALTAKSAAVGPVPLPLGFWPHLRSLSVCLDPNPETPFHIDLSGITLSRGDITVP